MGEAYVLRGTLASTKGMSVCHKKLRKYVVPVSPGSTCIAQRIC